jgi:hypothetical protein
VITRNEGWGGGGAWTPPEHGGGSVGATDAPLPGDRARANLALLYGGAGRRPIGRVVVEPSGRSREAAPDGGAHCCR